MEVPPILSFFTGAGFLDLGLIMSGFPIVWSSEIDHDYCDAHDLGMSTYFAAQERCDSPPLITRRDDIQKIGPGSIRREAFGLRARGEVFGIIGGPPCPDFSVGGKNRGFEGERGRLTRVFIDRICEL